MSFRSRGCTGTEPHLDAVAGRRTGRDRSLRPATCRLTPQMTCAARCDRCLTGVMSYDASQRAKEIGIRVALLLVAAVAAAYVRGRRATAFDLRTRCGCSEC